MDQSQIQETKTVFTRILGFLLLRLQEPSSWRGIILALTASGTALSPSHAQAIISIGMLLAGIVGMVFPDFLRKAADAEVHDFHSGGFGNDFGGFDVDNPDVPHETKRAPR